MYIWNMYEIKNETIDFNQLEQLALLIKRLGNPESTTLLHSPCEVFQVPQLDGVIGYYKIGNCAVAVGDPICLPKDTEVLTNAFRIYCQQHNWKTIYLLVYQEFAYWCVKNGCQTLIQVGSELSIDPTIFEKKQKLRWKINQSIKQGVTVKEYKEFDPALEIELKRVTQNWLKQRSGPQIHLGNLNFFRTYSEKRVFYAELRDQVVGILLLTRVDRFQGWVVSSYLAVTEAPTGTTENLMCSVVDVLAEEKCSFLCLGAVSGEKLGEVVGLSSFGKSMAEWIFKAARSFFKLDAKAKYLNKYNPSLRATFFLCSGRLAIEELLAIKHVLNVKI